jgi:hypothetical protein
VNSASFRRQRIAHRATLLAIVLSVLLAIPALGAPADRSTNVLYDMETAEPVEGSSSSLVRTNSGLSMTVRTTGLTPRHTYTVWWVVFNNPDACEHGMPQLGFACGEADLFDDNGHPNAETGAAVGYAAGNVVGNSGKSGFGSSLKLHDDSGFLFGMLTNPRGAEIHFVVRDHGPKNPEWMPRQIHTFEGGCMPVFDEDGNQIDGDPLLEPGEGFPCFDPQFTFHAAS